MAGERTLETRVREKQEQLERTLKKAEQYKEQLKLLKVKAQNEERKQRTHKLITCGAELSALYGHVLEIEEVYTLINYLKEQNKCGKFDFTKNEKAVLGEVVMEREEKQKPDDDFGFDGMFDF